MIRTLLLEYRRCASVRSTSPDADEGVASGCYQGEAVIIRDAGVWRKKTEQGYPNDVNTRECIGAVLSGSRNMFIDDEDGRARGNEAPRKPTGIVE